VKKNDILRVKIESFGASGEGVTHVDGMAVFVPRALPGETVEIRIVKAEKRLAFGRVEQILEPSADRREPACPYERQCGGCVCQHMSYDAQLRFKREQVKNCMSHIAGLDIEVPPVIGMDDPYYYRNKVSLPVGGTAEVPVIGYYAERSHRIVDIDRCLIAKRPADAVVKTIRRWMVQCHIAPYNEEKHSGLLRHIMMRVNRSGEVMVVLIIREKKLPHADELRAMLKESVSGLVSLCISVNAAVGNVILGNSYEVIRGQDRLQDTLCGNAFMLSPLSFFQVNPEQTEKLYNTALEFAALTGNETVADLYCGAGTISLMLAKHARFVTGIEIVPAAIRDANANAKLNGIDNVEFYCGEAEKVMPELAENGMKADVIMMDPPRKGAEKAVLIAAAQTGAKKIVYVSCNPATQARDAAVLTELGYIVTRCQSVDMFCQTAGVENILLFEKE